MVLMVHGKANSRSNLSNYVADCILTEEKKPKRMETWIYFLQRAKTDEPGHLSVYIFWGFT